MPPVQPAGHPTPVLRAQRKPNGDIFVVEVHVEDACCGPNEPMRSDVDALFEKFEQQVAVCAASLFQPYEVDHRRQSPTSSPERRRRRETTQLPTIASNVCSPNLELNGSHIPHSENQNTAAYLHATACGGSHGKQLARHPPVRGTGAAIARWGGSHFHNNRDVAMALESLRRDAEVIRDEMRQEHKRELREQEAMYERRVAALHAEIIRLERFLQQEGALSRSLIVAQHSLLSTLHPSALVESHASGQVSTRRGPNGPAPLSPRKPFHRSGAQTSEGVFRETLEASDLNPKQITEALVHLLEKRPQKQGERLGPRGAKLTS